MAVGVLVGKFFSGISALFAAAEIGPSTDFPRTLASPKFKNFFLDILVGFDIIIKLSYGSKLNIVQFS